LQIKSSNIEKNEAKGLSGGNQQKVVLGKWLLNNPNILIVDEPTRGVDVGAKHEIYSILNKIADDAELTKVFRKAFPDTWQQILSLAWYMTSTGDALSHAESWCRNHEVPGNKVLSSLRISELLSKMREDERQTFFKLWGRQASEKDYLCYDIPRFPPTRNRMNDLKV